MRKKIIIIIIIIISKNIALTDVTKVTYIYTYVCDCVFQLTSVRSVIV